MEHSKFMRAALKEAAKGLGLTSPNPAVGAVIVKGGRILARGWHRRAGLPHAEVDALNALASPGEAKGATMYITLEPCCTHGRTPPCTEAILAAGIRRVVVGTSDPHPDHGGRGMDLLRARGVQVVSGVLEAECRRMNRAFFKWIVTGLPWVVAKAALSLDGKITRPSGEGQWLTGLQARRDAHRLRYEADAVLVGAGTVRADDPALTVRGISLPDGKNQPWRVVLTRTGELPPHAQLFSDAHSDRTIVYQNKPLAQVLAELGGVRKVTSVLAEGGGQLLGELFAAELVDEVCFYLAPMLCGGSKGVVEAPADGPRFDGATLEDVQYRRLGKDLRLTGLVSKKPPAAD